MRLAEHVTDVLHANRAPVRIRDEHLPEERVEWRADLSHEDLGIAGPNLTQDVKDVGAPERALRGQQLVEEDAEREDVGGGGG